MKRIQLFEFEDFQWFPAVIRDSMTKLLVVFHKMTGTSETLANLLSQIKEQNDFHQIIDLGSGSGGAMPEALKIINEKEDAQKVKLVLTDLHPNEKYRAEINKLNDAQLSYSSESVNATDLSNSMKGLKTMIASFHHMPPVQAKKILKSAQENRTPLFILEITENNIPTLLWWLLLPLSLSILIIMSLVMTIFVRPLTWQQLLFTYLLPIIPLCFAWDGQASLVRTYTFDDLKEMIADIKTNDYAWKMEVAKNSKGRKAGYYLYGYPKK